MAGWFADDTDLSNLAWNVEARGAGWGIAPRRGTNLIIPGADGTLWNPKPMDEKTFILDMWVQGSNTDGTMPSSGTEQTLVRDNIDTLTALFGSGRLIEVARVETGAVYGRKNLLMNPSVERSAGKEIVRENQIGNPSGEYSSGNVVTRRNYAPNPSMEFGRKETAHRTNWVPNPRMSNEGQERIVRVNLLPNPSLESELRPWKDNNLLSTATRSSTKGVLITWPESGKYSLRVQTTGTGGIRAASGSFPVTTGLTYAFQARGLSYPTDGLTRTLRIVIRWKNRVGALIGSAVNIDQTGVAQGTPTTVSGTAVAPALAVSCVIALMTTASAAGDFVYWDKMMVEQAAAVGTWFDGDADETDGIRYRWGDETGAGRSEAFTVKPRGWETNATGRQLALTTAIQRYGKMSAKVLCTAITGVRELLIQQGFRGGAQVDPDTVISASIMMHLGSTIGTTRTITGTLLCYDADGNLLGVAYNAGTTTPMTDVNLTQSAGEWITLSMENLQTRKKTARVCIALYTGEAWAVNDYVYFQAGLVETAANVDDYFDGTMRDDDQFSYEWAGDLHWSESVQTGYRVVSWSSFGARHFRTNTGRVGDTALRLMADRGGSASPYVYATALDVLAGRTHILSAYVNPSAAQTLQVGYSIDAGVTWTWATGVACTAGVYTRINSGAITGFNDVDYGNLMIGVRVNGTLADSTWVDIESVLFETGDVLKPYFDGDSGKRYDWEEEQYTSISTALGKKADGWAAYGAGRPYVERVSGGNGTPYAVQATSIMAGDFGITTGQDGVDDDLFYSAAFDCFPPRAGTVRVGLSYHAKDGTFISETSTDTAVGAGVWTRCAHVGSNPPAGAVTTSPWVVFRTGVSGDQLLLDKGVFGFGGTTTYGDGDSGGGWAWKGVKSLSESVQYNVVPDNWVQEGGTIARSAVWSTSRSYCGLYTTVSAVANWRFYPVGEESRQEARRFRIKLNQSAVFALDLYAPVTCKVRLGFIPRKWTGWGWVTTTAPVVWATAITLSAGVAQRASLTSVVGGPAYDATHFLPVVEVQSAAGGNPAAGTVVRWDSALLTYDGTDTTYLDGEMPNVRWQGAQDLSVSKRIGPARRCMAEVRSAVDMTSINATMARFAVELVVPKGAWEDPAIQTEKFVMGRNGSILTLEHLVGATAPINDAIFTLNGPFNDLTITDLGTGAWVNLDVKLQDDETVILDSDNRTLVNRRGKSLIENLTHNGSTFLLPLLTPAGETAPRIRFDAKSIGRGATVTVAARRRYHAA